MEENYLKCLQKGRLCSVKKCCQKQEKGPGCNGTRPNIFLFSRGINWNLIE